MVKKNKNIKPVEQKATAELVKDYLAAGGKIKVLPARPAPGAYRAGVVGSMTRK